MTEEELLEEGPNIPNASIQPPPMDTTPGPVIPATVNLSNGASASAPSPRAGLSSSNEMATVFNGDWTTVNYRGRRLGRHFMQKGMDEHKAFEIVKAKFSKLAISPESGPNPPKANTKSDPNPNPSADRPLTRGAGPALSYKATLTCTKLGIIPSSPQLQYTQEDIDVLKREVIGTVIKILDKSLFPSFHVIQARIGCLVITAANEQSVKWLHKHRTRIGELCGIKFQLIPESEIPPECHHVGTLHHVESR